MSRQKVPDDKRQRTAQACDYCKRRKQKCNGTKPCSTCTKKSVTCTYSTGVGQGPRSGPGAGSGVGTGPATGSSMSSSRPSTDDTYDGSAASSSASPPKRRHIESSSTSVSTEIHSFQLQHHHHRLNYHSHGSISSMSSVTPQPKLEIDSKARLKMKPMPHASSSSLSLSSSAAGASRSWGGRRKEVSIELETSFLQNHGQGSLYQPVSAQDSGRPSTDGGLEEQTRASSTSGHEEEAILLQTTRMLQDQKGRLLYIGDSATLSFLHLFRLMVESISGQSQFTLDPRKESIVENVLSLPPYVRPPSMLPDRHTADVLTESFFINTSSIIEVFDRHEFLAELDRCYTNPLMASSHFLCLLNLSFAIGLAMSTPDVGGPNGLTVIRPLLDLPYNQAELFFRTAKVMDDPLSGIEDADLWSVQAQLLMSVYMLAMSKRNAAFTYHGIAVRSAIALGLHREETMINFTPSEVLLRCNIWKSLYVLDRFIAASLGRPPAISDNDCTDVAFKDAMMVPQIAPIGPLGQPGMIGQGNNTASTPGGLAPAPPSSSSSSSHPSMTGRSTPSRKINNYGFDASVRGCRIIGIILKKMYARRRVSSHATSDIVRQCSVWAKEMNESLRWQRSVEFAAAVAAGKASHVPHAQSIAILHTNLFYCHAVILLTRPFFLFLVQADRRNHANANNVGGTAGNLNSFFGTLNRSGSRTGISRISGANRSSGGFGSNAGRYSSTPRSRTERFAENCVTASYHTIAMIAHAYNAKYIPKRDPFIMHFLFTATLLIMTNEFIAMFHNTAYGGHIVQATQVMRYFSATDPQATRLVWILEALQEVVDRHICTTPNGNGPPVPVAAPAGPAANPSAGSTVPEISGSATAPGDNTTTVSSGGDTQMGTDLPKANEPIRRMRTTPRTFRFEFPKDFIPGITDPIDTFFDRQPAHAAVGGGAVPFGGGRSVAGKGFQSTVNTRHTARSQLAQPLTEENSGSGTGFGASQPLDCINVDTGFTGRPQSGGEPQQGLMGMQNTPGIPAQLSSFPPGQTQKHGGTMFGNEGSEGTTASNPLVLPPPYGLPSTDFSPQFQTQPQHHQQHQHPMHFTAGTGGDALGQGVYNGMDNKAGGDDGSDSMGTDGEGFDFDILWNCWHNQVGQEVGADGSTPGNAAVGIGGINIGMAGLGTEGVPNTMNYVHPPQPPQAGDTEMSGYGDAGRAQADNQGPGPEQGGDLDLKHGPTAAHNAPVPLPPMYSPYGMAPLSGGIGNTALGLSGMHGGSLATSLNVPLYTTTDFG